MFVHVTIIAPLQQDNNEAARRKERERALRAGREKFASGDAEQLLEPENVSTHKDYMLLLFLFMQTNYCGLQQHAAETQACQFYAN